MLHRVLTGPGLTLVAVGLTLATAGLLSAQEVPTPESHFGYKIGSERTLANWTELTAYYVPGSILEMRPEPSHALNEGLPEWVGAWFSRDSRAFNISDASVRVTARFSDGNPLRSGWLLGPEYVAGKPAVVEVSIGEGSVVLIGFQPNYRAQTVATWPMLFNALALGPDTPRRLDLEDDQ